MFRMEHFQLRTEADAGLIKLSYCKDRREPPAKDPGFPKLSKFQLSSGADEGDGLFHVEHYSYESLNLESSANIVNKWEKCPRISTHPSTESELST
jgi:hypothetical protein